MLADAFDGPVKFLAIFFAVGWTLTFIVQTNPPLKKWLNDICNYKERR